MSDYTFGERQQIPIPKIDWNALNQPPDIGLLSSVEVDYADADTANYYHPQNNPEILDYVKRYWVMAASLLNISQNLGKKVRLYSDSTSDTLAMAYMSREIWINLVNLNPSDSQNNYFYTQISSEIDLSNFKQEDVQKAITLLSLYKSMLHEAYHIRERQVMDDRIVKRDTSTLDLPESESELTKYLAENNERRVRGFQIRFLKELLNSLQTKDNLTEVEVIWRTILPSYIKIFEEKEIEISEHLSQFPRKQVFRF